jgi:hypothetical protein
MNTKVKRGAHDENNRPDWWYKLGVFRIVIVSSMSWSKNASEGFIPVKS